MPTRNDLKNWALVVLALPAVAFWLWALGKIAEALGWPLFLGLAAFGCSMWLKTPHIDAWKGAPVVHKVLGSMIFGLGVMLVVWIMTLTLPPRP